MEASNIGYRLWAIAIYLVLTNLKVSLASSGN